MKTTMKTAAEILPVSYVKDERSWIPTPKFRSRWSQLRQLQWKASLIMSECPGLKLYVMKGRSFSNGIFQYGLFQISYNEGGYSVMDSRAAWDLLNGINTGFHVAMRLKGEGQ